MSGGPVLAWDPSASKYYLVGINVAEGNQVTDRSILGHVSLCSSLITQESNFSGASNPQTAKKSIIPIIYAHLAFLNFFTTGENAKVDDCLEIKQRGSARSETQQVLEAGFAHR